MFNRDNNTITGSEDSDTIIFEVILNPEGQSYPQLIVNGLGGNDTINPVSNSEWFQHLIIDGGDGDDVIWDNDGEDFLSGGAGDDIIHSIKASPFDGHDTVMGGAGNDTITIAGEVVADGGDDNDVFIMRPQFLGFSGKADLSGGDGEDEAIIFGDLTRVKFDSIEHLIVDREVTLGSKILESVTHISSYNGKSANFYLANAATIDSALFDTDFRGTITGSSRADVLNFSKSTAEMTLAGGAGDDIIKGGSVNDTIDGNAGNDTIYGGAGDDQIAVEGGLNSSQKGDGNNLVFGGSGNDRIQVGVKGTSTVSGGAGDDIFQTTYYAPPKGVWRGDGGDDLFDIGGTMPSDFKVIGGAGKDTIKFTGEIPDGTRIDVEIITSKLVEASAKVLNSFNEIDAIGHQVSIVLAKPGVFAPKSIQDKVVFWGSDGDDTINLSHTSTPRGWTDVKLGKGNDTFIGTRFDDKVYGEKGNDTFVFNDHSGNDTIFDFTNNIKQADVLDLSQSKIINNFKDVQAHLSEDGHLSFGHTVINLGLDAKHWELLTEANFIF